jgi:hypothetical protein
VSNEAAQDLVADRFSGFITTWFIRETDCASSTAPMICRSGSTSTPEKQKRSESQALLATPTAPRFRAIVPCAAVGKRTAIENPRRRCAMPRRGVRSTAAHARTGMRRRLFRGRKSERTFRRRADPTPGAERSAAPDSPCATILRPPDSQQIRQRPDATDELATVAGGCYSPRPGLGGACELRAGAKRINDLPG